LAESKRTGAPAATSTDEFGIGRDVTARVPDTSVVATLRALRF
jgi:hypothetical protein